MSYRKSAVAVALVTAVLASHALAQPASKAEAAPTLQTMPGRNFGGVISAGSPRALSAGALGGSPPAPELAPLERSRSCDKLGKVHTHMACPRFTSEIRLKAATDSGKT